MAIFECLTGFLLATQAPVPASPAPPAVIRATASTPIDPSRLSAAQSLLSLMKVEQTLDGVFIQLAPAFAQAVLGASVTNQVTKSTIEALLTRDAGNKDRMIAILSQEFMTSIKAQYPLIIERAAKEYAAAFTTDELIAITQFYRSGVGAKFLSLMPLLQQKLSSAGQEFGRVAGERAATRAVDRITQEMAPSAEKPRT